MALTKNWEDVRMFDGLDYRHHVRRLPDESGGVFLVTFPDLPGCMAEGDTLEEAIGEAREALRKFLARPRAES